MHTHNLILDIYKIHSILHSFYLYLLKIGTDITCGEKMSLLIQIYIYL